jgi:hypothetical protein
MLSMLVTIVQNHPMTLWLLLHKTISCQYDSPARQ